MLIKAMTYYEQHNIQVGRHTYGEPICKGNANKVTIGSFCSIGSNVILDRGMQHRLDNVSTFPFHTLYPEIPSNIKIRGDILVGNDLWIGNDVVIMGNVKIGDGAVIGMRCIVSKDVEPYQIVVGAPQRVLGTRVPYKYIHGLLKLQWWNFEEEEIKEIAPLLASNDLDKLFERYGL